MGVRIRGGAPKKRCPECERTVSLMPDGTYRAHRRVPNEKPQCPNSGKQPKN